MKKYILIAGVNGVGKSTFYQTLDCFQNIPRINTDEIAYRVAHGGHGIPDADVEHRYRESMENLGKVIKKCDLVVLYDNTKAFRRFAIYRYGKLLTLSEHSPEWYRNLDMAVRIS